MVNQHRAPVSTGVWKRLQTLLGTILLLFVSLLSVRKAAALESALIIEPGGIKPELSFGKVIQVAVAPDSTKVTFGSEDYPRASFAFQENGCFAVGVETGLKNGVFRDPTFSGAGKYAGEDSISFAAIVSGDISADAEICPKLDEPMLLVPIQADDNASPHPGKAGSTQRMIAIGVSDPGVPARKGERINTRLEAYCRDRSLHTPESDIHFSVKPGFRASSDLETAIAKHPPPRIMAVCVWASYPEDYWPHTVDEIWDDRPRTLTSVQVEQLYRELSMQLSREESFIEPNCGFRSKLTAAVTQADLQRLLQCYPNRDLEDCAVAGFTRPPYWKRISYWILGGALFVVGAAVLAFLRARRKGGS